MKTYDEMLYDISVAVDETIADQPELEDMRDEVVTDMVAALILSEDVSDEVAWEVCRTQLGFVPSDVRRLRPQVAALERVRDEEGW